ncbi:MAG: hypothetical protein SGPRY_002548 [Prymnesium sp.]
MKLAVPGEMEHKLESLCLALRELRMPIFKFMILNNVNVLVEKDTFIAEALKHREVRRHGSIGFYNWYDPDMVTCPCDLSRRMNPKNPGHSLSRVLSSPMQRGGSTGDLVGSWCGEPAMPGLLPDNPYFHIILRLSNTTHIIEGENMQQHFNFFKNKYHQTNINSLNTKVTSGNHPEDKIGIRRFTRQGYWVLRDAKAKRERVSAEASVDPELLTVQSEPEDGAHPVPCGATGDECVAKVKEKTEKREAKEEGARQKKEQRVAQLEQLAVDEIELSSSEASLNCFTCNVRLPIQTTLLHRQSLNLAASLATVEMTIMKK